VRGFWAITLLALCGCASQPAAPPSADQHAANIAAAEQAGYRAVTRGDHTIFCPTASATGSHMGATCISERDFQALLGSPRGVPPNATVQHQSPGPGPGAGH
jgi:hypothetical protein